MNGHPYNDTLANRLEDYLRSRFNGLLTDRCLAFVSHGLRTAERCQKVQPCEPVVLAVRDLAELAFLSVNTVRDIIDKADGICIEKMTGQPVLGGPATQIRRLTIEEMENPSEKASRMRNYNPPAAAEVAHKLHRPVSYAGKTVTPLFAVHRTGRIYTSKPNIQADPNRLRNLVVPGHVAMEVDYRQAEPTVLWHVLRDKAGFQGRLPVDLYDALASALSIPREQAKQDFLKLFYCPNTLATFKNLCLVQNHPMRCFAEAVHAYKMKLWNIGKQQTGKYRRHAITLGGTLVEALKGESMHKGKLLAWQIQGSVADAVNSAVLELLDRESTDQWLVICPVHDSVIVTAKRDCGAEIADVMQRHARKYRVELKTKCEVQACQN